MMMGWGGGSPWLSVVAVVVGLALLATAVWLIQAMYRRPHVDPRSPDSPDSPGAPDSPEARAARGEMDRDQLRREQHDARGSGGSSGR